jgi:branched-chain amino acid transport system substrate-binding protein
VLRAPEGQGTAPRRAAAVHRRTFALTEKAPGDKIPLITAATAAARAQDGGVFKWNFPLVGTYWVAADALIQHIAKKEGGSTS